MSYGDYATTDQLSYCAAEWLDAHRYFNDSQNSFDQVPTIEMLDPSFVSPPNTIRLSFEITHSEKLHQAQLLTNSFTNPGNPVFDPTTLLDCKSLNGNNTIIEFVTTELALASEYVLLGVIDEHGNFTHRRFPIDLTTLLPDSEPISIPDANLAAAIRESIGLAPGSPITKLDMLSLGILNAPGKQIMDLTGLEHATNLGRVFLHENQIADITPFKGLTRIRSLVLAKNKITDISPLAGSTRLNTLSLFRNGISDISPLAGFMDLATLDLRNNRISDISPLAGLKKLRYLRLNDNPIKDREPLLELLRKNPDVKIYLKGKEPLPVTLSHFRAEHTDTGVVLKWTTESEVDNAGFYIYRSATKEGEFKVVNPSMIRGAGTTGERNEYTWTDTTAKPNTVYYYRIEDVSHAGVRKQLATVRL